MKLNIEDYYSIDECVRWLSNNKYSNEGMNYTYQRVAQLINDYINVSNLTKEEYEKKK